MSNDSSPLSPAIPTPPALLSWPAVRALVPLSRATIWAMRRNGTFPEPIRISDGRIAWRHADLVAWIEQRAQAR